MWLTAVMLALLCGHYWGLAVKFFLFTESFSNFIPQTLSKSVFTYCRDTKDTRNSAYL
jgi:hypothetical protein